MDYLKNYNELFSDKDKQDAFDQIAKMYYMNNFGTVPKGEIDLLMFSMYLDKLYENGNEDTSDYAISKTFGITQSRIASLKERKELKYPSDFNWREQFLILLRKAEIQDGKIRIFINDQRLYTELNYQINRLGGYSETTLTKQLLVVSPPVFIDLILEAMPEEKEKKAVIEELCKILEQNRFESENFLKRKQSFKEVLKGGSKELAKNVIKIAVDRIPIVGPYFSQTLGDVFDAIKEYL